MEKEIKRKIQEAIRRMEEARDKDKIAEYPYNRCIRILREVMDLKGSKTLMTLEEAIKHCEEVVIENEKTIVYYTMQGDKEWLDECEKDCLEYAAEYRQLAEWLRKLKTFEEAKERIIEVSWEHTFTFSDESEPMTYKICALDTVLEILGGKR